MTGQAKVTVPRGGQEPARALDRDAIVRTAEEVAETLDASLSSAAVVAEVARTIGQRAASKEAIAHVLRVQENPPPALSVSNGSAILDATYEAKAEVLAGGQLMTGEVMGWYGPGGVGKSLLLMQMGLCLAYGVPFLDERLSPVGGARRVLFLSGEGRPEMHQRRFESIERAVAAHPEAVEGGRDRYLALRGGGPVPVRLELPSHVARLRAIVEEHEVEVVLLDSFRTLHGANENASEEMEAVWFGLRQLLDDTEAAAIVTHHSKKGAGSNKREAARGGSFQENVATAWSIDFGGKGDPDGALVIEPTKTRNGPSLPKMLLERDASLCCSLKGAKTADESSHPEFVAALQKRGGSARLADLAKLEGLPSERTIKKWAEKEPEVFGIGREGDGGTAPVVISLLPAID